MKNCFDKTRKKQNGFPKFKSSKHSRKSYTTNNQKGTVSILDDRYIKLPKVGKVKAVIHRKPDADWIIKFATISQDSDGKYYVSVLFEFEKITNKVALSDNVLGLDYASDGLYTDSNGNAGINHKYYCESHNKMLEKGNYIIYISKETKEDDGIVWYYNPFIDFDHYDGKLYLNQKEIQGELAVTVSKNTKKKYFR